jgi:thioesterase DpgC
VVEVRREGRAGHVLLKNQRFLNAEDDVATAALETGVDLALLDPDIEVGVLRGAPLEHPRYAGRRVFQAGINLTHLYHGKISFVDFFIAREVGFINKIFRGHAGPAFIPGGPERTREKPWIAAVEAFAIGGGCQVLLVMDRVIAERGAYFNLPARKEGIIPGLANLRLPRMAGERLARQGIFFERKFEADSAEGRLICDEIVEPGEMDAAIARTVEQLTMSGAVSGAANRKALRAGQEPPALFQAYMATYAREQAFCQVSPALIDNLERYWNAQQRRP